MTSPFHIRQSNRKQSMSRSVDNNNYLEFASFDSTRTDLSANSKDVIIADQWVVLGRIGEGSFGEVFEAEDIHTFRHYAIKREPLKMRHPQIQHESNIYDALVGGPGIPQCHWHGQHDGFDCIVIDLLGPNLNQLKQVTQKFSIDIVVELGIQMVTILEHIHKRGLIYRDIKPDNFLFSAKHLLPEPDMLEHLDEHGMPFIKYITPTCEQVFKKWNDPHPKLYIVDFGLTTWWRNPTTNKPYPDTKKNIKNKTGTARYASLNVHRGKVHSRRDDIESVGYLLLDLIFGTLPWTGIQARNSRAGWDRMKQLKEDTFMSDLCAGLPQGFLEFIEYARKLKFMDEPNYDLLREFLKGSIDGRYSTIVKSPFGGHTERKWLQDIEKNTESPTRAELGKPYSNAQPTGRQYYEPPQHNRQRRPSYNPPSLRHEDTGVFDMDDLAHNLPQKTSTPPLSATKGNNKPKSRSNRNNYNENTGSSSYQKLLAKNRKKQKRVGWNSHKHDEAPWAPVTDWDTTAPSKTNFTNLSWGENQPNTEWGQHQKLKEEEEEGTWAASVTKPWD